MSARNIPLSVWQSHMDIPLSDAEDAGALHHPPEPATSSSAALVPDVEKTAPELGSASRKKQKKKRVAVSQATLRALSAGPSGAWKRSCEIGRSTALNPMGDVEILQQSNEWTRWGFSPVRDTKGHLVPIETMKATAMPRGPISPYRHYSKPEDGAQEVASRVIAPKATVTLEQIVADFNAKNSDASLYPVAKATESSKTTLPPLWPEFALPTNSLALLVGDTTGSSHHNIKADATKSRVFTSTAAARSRALDSVSHRANVLEAMSAKRKAEEQRALTDAEVNTLRHAAQTLTNEEIVTLLHHSMKGDEQALRDTKKPDTGMAAGMDLAAMSAMSPKVRKLVLATVAYKPTDSCKASHKKSPRAPYDPASEEEDILHLLDSLCVGQPQPERVGVTDAAPMLSSDGGTLPHIENPIDLTAERAPQVSSRATTGRRDRGASSSTSPSKQRHASAPPRRTVKKADASSDKSTETAAKEPAEVGSDEWFAEILGTKPKRSLQSKNTVHVPRRPLEDHVARMSGTQLTSPNGRLGRPMRSASPRNASVEKQVESLSRALESHASPIDMAILYLKMKVADIDAQHEHQHSMALLEDQSRELVAPTGMSSSPRRGMQAGRSRTLLGRSESTVSDADPLSDLARQLQKSLNMQLADTLTTKLRIRNEELSREVSARDLLRQRRQSTRAEPVIAQPPPARVAMCIDAETQTSELAEEPALPKELSAHHDVVDARLAAAMQAVARLSDINVKQFSLQGSPDPANRAIAAALCILVSSPTPNWETMQRLLSKPNAAQRIASISPADINVDSRAPARELIAPYLEELYIKARAEYSQSLLALTKVPVELPPRRTVTFESVQAELFVPEQAPQMVVGKVFVAGVLAEWIDAQTQWVAAPSLSTMMGSEALLTVKASVRKLVSRNSSFSVSAGMAGDAPEPHDKSEGTSTPREGATSFAVTTAKSIAEKLSAMRKSSKRASITSAGQAVPVLDITAASGAGDSRPFVVTPSSADADDCTAATMASRKHADATTGPLESARRTSRSARRASVGFLSAVDELGIAKGYDLVGAADRRVKSAAEAVAALPGSEVDNDGAEVGGLHENSLPSMTSISGTHSGKLNGAPDANPLDGVFLAAQKAMLSLSAAEWAGLTTRVPPASDSFMLTCAACVCLLLHKPTTWRWFLAVCLHDGYRSRKFSSITPESVDEQRKAAIINILASRNIFSLVSDGGNRLKAVLPAGFALAQWLCLLVAPPGSKLSTIGHGAAPSARQSFTMIDDAIKALVEHTSAHANQSLSSASQALQAASGLLIPKPPLPRSPPSFRSTAPTKREFARQSKDGDLGAFAFTGERVIDDNAICPHLENRRVDSVAMLATRGIVRARLGSIRSKLARKIELKNVIVRAGQAMKLARANLSQLDSTDLGLFCAQSPAPPEAVTIAAALCIILGVKPNWKYITSILQEAGTKEFLAGLKPYAIPDKAVAVAGKILRNNGMLVRTQVERSPLKATTALYNWLLIVTDDAVNRSIKKQRQSVWGALASDM